MLTFKKIALVILAAGSHVAFATPNERAGILDVPCEASTWSLGASALYLRPTFGGNGLGYSSFSNYGTDINNNVLEVNGAPNHLNNVLPKHGWGFQLEATYDFGTGNDLDVSWYHLDNITDGQLPIGTLFAGSASALYAGLLTVEPSWNAVNVEVGQYIDFCDELILRLHAGLEFARIKNTFTNYPQLTPTGSPIFVTTDKITYTGLGPRIGSDFSYAVGCTGLGVYVKGAASLLAGKAKQTVSGYHDLGGFNLYSTGNYTQSNSGIVISELEGKLGLKYDYPFAQGLLGLDLGYMWLTYLNALVSQVGSGVVSSSISNSSAANFDLNGLYFGFTWTANV